MSKAAAESSNSDDYDLIWIIPGPFKKILLTLIFFVLLAIENFMNFKILKIFLLSYITPSVILYYG